MSVIPQFFRRHRAWSIAVSVVAFIFVTFPIWLAQVWTLFSEKPFAQAMSERGWGWLVITPRYGWFCFAIGLALCGLWVMVTVRDRRSRFTTSGLNIESARYGVGGSEYIDVTEAVSRLAVHGRLDTIVGNDTLGVSNPYPRQKKHLIVRYSLDAAPTIETVRTEGARLTLPEGSGTPQNSPIRLPGFEFYPSRQVLSVHRPLKEHIKSADSVWALWNVGTTAWAQDVAKVGRITRLLLPNPRSAAVLVLAASIHRHAKDELAPDIKGLTKQAMAAGVEVRWHNHMAADTLTIGNPESRSAGWVLCESVIPLSGATERPSYRITQDAYPDLFAELLRVYEALWAEATVPTEVAPRS